MPTGHYRFRRSFGNVSSRFRGARPDTYPLFTGLLDSYPGAAAAYSLRALTSNWLAGDVVEVRRSSDSTTQGFTASQITSGAMLDFVNNGTSDLYNSAMYFDGVDDYVSGISLAIADGASFELMVLPVGVSLSPYILSDTSDSMRISSAYGVRIRVGGVNYTFGTGLSDGVLYKIKVTKSGSNVTVFVNDVSLGTQAIPDFSFDRIGQLGATYFNGTIYDVKENDTLKYIGDGNANSNWLDQIGSNNGTVNGSPALYTGQTFDGFVSTWYDQSGNGNDATQATTTAQPKIVSAGALVTGGIDFDGVDDSLFTSLPVLTDTFSIFCAADASALTANLGVYSQHITGSSNRFAFSESGAGNQYTFFKEPTTISTTQQIGAGRQLTTNIKNGTSVAIHIDGGSDEGGTLASATVLSAKFSIASANEGTAAFSPLIASEIIVYNSDQTANRTAIETNINDHYSIY